MTNVTLYVKEGYQSNELRLIRVKSILKLHPSRMSPFGRGRVKTSQQLKKGRLLIARSKIDYQVFVRLPDR
jgi:hypothetical protein